MVQLRAFFSTDLRPYKLGFNDNYAPVSHQLGSNKLWLYDSNQLGIKSYDWNRM